jgi:RNA polymerase sigma-70 factor (ECF subfamily)
MITPVGATLDPDPSAFFKNHYPAVYRFVSATTGAPDPEVEDIVQETLLRAWRDRERFRGDATSLTWILQIAKRRIQDGWRKARRGAQAGAAIRAIRKMDSELAPEDLLQDDEFRGRIREALDALPAKYASLLTLRFFEARSIRELAQMLGDSEDAVESLLRRAKDAFRKSLQKGIEDDGGP